MLHFALAGAALFGAYAVLNPDPSGDDAPAREVRIGAGDLRWLVETWSRQWHREPTPEELKGLLSALVREEVLAREARALGLDEGDTVVRRRLAQKMEFLLQDSQPIADPTEAELRALHAERAERFGGETRVSLVQIYFSPQRRKDAAQDARAALAQLNRSASAPSETLGDPTMLESELRAADLRTMAAIFGDDFARKVIGLGPGRWYGPLESTYGIHLVRIDDVQASPARPFEAVRDEVVALWRERARREADDATMQRLLSKYDVIIDPDVRAALAPPAAIPARSPGP